MRSIEVLYISEDIKRTLAEVEEVRKQLQGVFSETDSPLTNGVKFDGLYLRSLLERLERAGDPVRHALEIMTKAL